MISGVTFWAGIGTFYLLILTFKDQFNKMIVDDRHNWMMYGVTIALIPHFPVKIWYLLVLIVVAIALNWYMRKTKSIGTADVNTITWMIYGYGIIGIKFLFLFFIIFLFFEIIYTVLKLTLIKNLRTATPFYAVLLGTFVLNNIVFGLYF